MRRAPPPHLRTALHLCAALIPAFAANAALAQGVPAPLAAEACLGCHGPGATGAGPIPALAGRPAAELAAAMAAFRADARPATIMNRIARGYSPAETAAIAAHLASLPPGGPR